MDLYIQSFFKFYDRVVNLLDSIYPYRQKLVIMNNFKFRRSIIVKKYLQSIRYYYLFMFTPIYTLEYNLGVPVSKNQSESKKQRIS